jgi:hypothetical protein
MRPSWEAPIPIPNTPTNYAPQASQVTQTTQYSPETTESILWTESASSTQSALWTESNMDTQSVLWTESSQPTQTNLWTESYQSTDSVLWTESAQATEPLLWTESFLWTESTVAFSQQTSRPTPLQASSTWNLMPLANGARPAASAGSPSGLNYGVPKGTLSKLSTSHLTNPSMPTRRPDISKIAPGNSIISSSPRFSLALPPRPSVAAPKMLNTNVLQNSIRPMDDIPRFSTSHLSNPGQNSVIPKLSTSHQTLPSRPTPLPVVPNVVPQTPVSMALAALKPTSAPCLLVLPPRPTLP